MVRRLLQRIRHIPRTTMFISVFAVLFSSWLMFHTFSYDTRTHQMHIAFKLWSDFGEHVPLIRSFSMGDNLTRFFHGTTQYPVFPGEPIRYHFLFFMVVGILEKFGMPIDWALNIPSIIGMACLIILLYVITNRLTGSRLAGIFTVIFFLFNGSLGFLRFFSLHPLSPLSLMDIMRAKEFPAFAPWGPGEVTAFWNLNIYTNQRHLAASFALIIAFILTCLRLEHKPFPKQVPWMFVWAGLMGVLPFFHQPALLILAVIMAVYMIFFPSLRMFLLTTGLMTSALVIPQLLAARGTSGVAEWYPGYTIHNELMTDPRPVVFLTHLATYWWLNLGFHYIFIPIGFVLLPKKAKIVLLPLLPLFIIPNLVKFSVEASANHKFFNFTMLLGSMCTAYLFTSVIRAVRRRHSIVLTAIATPFIGSALLLLCLSGIIDFFVVKNDVIGTVNDVAADRTASWIAENTPTNAVFLNSSYLYHPASVAGRAVFLGWPYFPWSLGYKENRMPVMNTMYETSEPELRCGLFAKYHISYITVEDVTNDVNLPKINLAAYLAKYTPVYLSDNGKYAIFTAAELCR